MPISFDNFIKCRHDVIRSNKSREFFSISRDDFEIRGRKWIERNVIEGRRGRRYVFLCFDFWVGIYFFFFFLLKVALEIFVRTIFVFT